MKLIHVLGSEPIIIIITVRKFPKTLKLTLIVYFLVIDKKNEKKIINMYAVFKPF